MSLIDSIDATDRRVRNFGIMFGVIGLLISAYIVYRGGHAWPWIAGASLLFIVTGYWLIPLLRPVYIGWMTFAFVLGWINTRLLLGLFFFLVLTPIGLLLRLTGKDLLGRKIDRTAGTYWIRRERREFQPEQYERLF